MTKTTENDERKAHGLKHCSRAPPPRISALARDGGGAIFARRFPRTGKLVAVLLSQADTPGCTIEARTISRFEPPAFAKAASPWCGRVCGPRQETGCLQDQASARHPPRVRRVPRDAAILRGLGRKNPYTWKTYMGIARTNRPDRSRWPRRPPSGGRSRIAGHARRYWRRRRRCEHGQVNGQLIGFVGKALTKERELRGSRQ